MRISVSQTTKINLLRINTTLRRVCSEQRLELKRDIDILGVGKIPLESRVWLVAGCCYHKQGNLCTAAPFWCVFLGEFEDKKTRILASEKNFTLHRKF